MVKATTHPKTQGLRFGQTEKKFTVNPCTLQINTRKLFCSMTQVVILRLTLVHFSMAESRVTFVMLAMSCTGNLWDLLQHFVNNLQDSTRITHSAIVDWMVS